MDFETRAIHEGQEPDPATGAITTPIYLTSTYVQEAVGEHKGYDYSRVANPTRTALQQCLASLESAEHGVAFASGPRRDTTIMHLLNPGDRMVLIADVYGGVYRMTSQVYEPKGYVFDYLPAAEFDELASHLDERTRIVWIETPSNPLLNIVDIRKAADAAHAAGAILVVDNTFATPYLQRPLELGADIVVHSTTKYLGGHSDVIGGFAATNDPTIAERLLFLQKSLGAVPGPLDCWLVLRGIKTLAVRMRQHCENAHALSGFLERHPRVEQVLYPGLPRHPGHTIAAKQMRDFGGMISFLRRVGGGSDGIRCEHEDLQARRIARRRREPHRVARAHDACVDGGCAVRGAAEPHPALCRPRVRRRPARGSRGGVRQGRRRNPLRPVGVAAPNRPKERPMRRPLLLAAALTALLLFPAAAAAKGPSAATIAGPGLAHAITIEGFGEGGDSSPLGILVSEAGFFPQVFEQTSRSTTQVTSGRTGSARVTT